MSAPAPVAGAAPAGEKPSYRRDFLLDIEQRVQAEWEAARIWEEDAKDAATRKPEDKYLATFPYPYMNGVLHLGHAFTLGKVDFECAYQRLKGKHVLFPFAYHVTGMPICAAADKLKREVAAYGNPPVFPVAPVVAEEQFPSAPETEAATPTAASAASSSTPSEKKDDKKKDDKKKADKGKVAGKAPAEKTDASADASSSVSSSEEKKEDKKDAKKKGGKGKVASKASKEVYQWNIMKEMGVPESEIHKFLDAKYWLGYFPPIATKDLKGLGVSVDFRRSFITTDVNPFYDSFIRWQFNTLRRRDKLEFGGRLSIFSPLDMQTCADHDRSEGEGVELTEYTLIKLILQQPYPPTIAKLAQDPKFAQHKIILPAATLRPETMYGQTNAWVLPDGEYGIFISSDSELFVCSQKSANNMAWQGLSRENGKVEQVGTILGKELLGCAVSAPYAKYEKLYCLPLTTIKMDKGTAIVTSVPSDAPADYAALMDLKNKPAFREKFGIKDEMVLPFEVQHIIETPGMGMQPAADICIAEKVISQSDPRLEDFKKKIYLAGFDKGIMKVGKYVDWEVKEAKGEVRRDMIKAGQAAVYGEPESRVVSRSGCECVVALADQWYLKYGEKEWKQIVKQHIDGTLELYNPEARKQFDLTIKNLHEWACSRSYGLGTFLPFDAQYVIESLSDSTIYMAYYTIAHLLQGPQDGHATAENAAFLNGSKSGLAGIKPEQMTDEIWNYIFLHKEFPKTPETTIPIATLDKLKNEFEYWYPLDLRVSGKDLINNHLTMSLYNHTAIWPGDAAKWPQSFFTNGHVQIDHEKMSKSTGNFITLEAAVKLYSADATRFALADAGDGMEDANFETKSANAAILKLTREEGWIKDMLEWNKKYPTTPLRSGPLNFYDRVFLNEISACIVQADIAYSKLQFREALKFAWHQLQNERDAYKIATDAEKNSANMHQDVLARYFEIEAILLSPICPHFSQHIWEITGRSGTNGQPKFIAKARWPTLPAEGVDPLLSRQMSYLRDVAGTLRRSLMETLSRFGKAPKPKAGEKAVVIEQWILDIAKAADGGVLVAENVTKLLNNCTLYVAASYPAWQVQVLQFASAQSESAGGQTKFTVEERKAMVPKLKAALPANAKFSDCTKYLTAVLDDLVVRGAAALELTSPFNEIEFLKQHMDFILRDLGITQVELKKSEEGPQVAAGAPATPEAQQVQVEALAAAKALPGRPNPFFYKK